MDRVRQLAAWLWPTLFGPQDVTEQPVDRISLPPEPMYRDPMDGDWRPLT